MQSEVWCSACNNCMLSGEVDNQQATTQARKVGYLSNQPDQSVLQDLLRSQTKLPQNNAAFAVAKQNFQSKKPTRKLHLRVLSSAFLEKGSVIEINELGLCGGQVPHRQAFDGVTFFGCKKTLAREVPTLAFSNSSSAIESRDELSHMVVMDQAATGGEQPSNRAHTKEIVNDFIIPVTKSEERDKHAGRQFQIRYDGDMAEYLIKDLGVGFGVFTESVGPVVLKDNLLINMGESYIVTNLVPLENPGPYDVVQLKLRVFSVTKADTPDLHCCQHRDQVMVVGRSPNCDIRVDDELLSKMQATVSFDRSVGSWVI